jgi:hypothetical protein
MRFFLDRLGQFAGGDLRFERRGARVEGIHRVLQAHLSAQAFWVLAAWLFNLNSPLNFAFQHDVKHRLECFNRAGTGAGTGAFGRHG